MSIGKKKSRKMFTKYAKKSHKRNGNSRIMRGGIRL